MGVRRVALLRHGESEWNQQNLFCSWYDAHLSKKGLEEAERAGQLLKGLKWKFDEVHTSLLTRAYVCVKNVLRVIEQEEVPVFKTWRLNERHYGALIGVNKSETATKYGEYQVKLWRRSFNVAPPPMTEDHPYYKCIVEDQRYHGVLSKEEFPTSESLEQTIARTLPYWKQNIEPSLRKGKTLLIVGHSNSLRGIVKYLNKMSDEAVMELNLPNGSPFIYELGEVSLEPIVSLKFLEEDSTVKEAMKAVADQGKAH